MNDQEFAANKVRVKLMLDQARPDYDTMVATLVARKKKLYHAQHWKSDEQYEEYKQLLVLIPVFKSCLRMVKTITELSADIDHDEEVIKYWMARWKELFDEKYDKRSEYDRKQDHFIALSKEPSGPLHPGSDGNLVDPDNRHFRMIDDRRRCNRA